MTTTIYDNNISKREEELSRDFDVFLLMKLEHLHKKFELNDADILRIWSDVKEKYVESNKYSDRLRCYSLTIFIQYLPTKLKEMEQYKNVKQEDILGLSNSKPDMIMFPSRQEELSGLF